MAQPSWSDFMAALLGHLTALLVLSQRHQERHPAAYLDAGGRDLVAETAAAISWFRGHPMPLPPVPAPPVRERREGAG